MAGYHGWHDSYIGSTSWPLGFQRPSARWSRRSRSQTCRRRGRARASPRGGRLRGARARGRARAGAGRRFRESSIWRTPMARSRCSTRSRRFRFAPGGGEDHFGFLADLGCFARRSATGCRSPRRWPGLDHGRASGCSSRGRTGARRCRWPPPGRPSTLSRRSRCTPTCGSSAAAPGRLRGRDPSSRPGGVGQLRGRVLDDRQSASPMPRTDSCRRALLQQELLKRGVLYNGSDFISYAHTPADIDFAIDAYAESFEILAGAARRRAQPARWPTGVGGVQDPELSAAQETFSPGYESPAARRRRGPVLRDRRGGPTTSRPRIARDLIDVAARAGADTVKTQVYSGRSLYRPRRHTSSSSRTSAPTAGARAARGHRAAAGMARRPRRARAQPGDRVLRHAVRRRRRAGASPRPASPRSRSPRSRSSTSSSWPRPPRRACR